MVNHRYFGLKAGFTPYTRNFGKYCLSDGRLKYYVQPIATHRNLRGGLHVPVNFKPFSSILPYLLTFYVSLFSFDGVGPTELSHLAFVDGVVFPEFKISRFTLYRITMALA